MVVTTLYIAALAAVLAGLGATVRHDGPVPDVEPLLARRVAEGLRVLRAVSDENARRTLRLLDELNPAPARSPRTHNADPRA
ncbi:hypothetical protein AB8O38_13695 [Saccharomonospora xinjiangensis]|uniref:hypothetical protein n=1 Tax=Saccharomonospora xinjiangensis TaxID=75294 RepID=UPI00350F443D